MPVLKIETVKEMQQLADSWRSKGQKIGLVPTMGYLHEGHLSLVRRARELADKVVVSIYVNPTQFGEDEDLESYPRDLDRDCALAEQNGTDVVFAPSDEEMYPQDYLTYVTVEGITKVLCGASRPIHFRGVTTVVTKLFNAVKPHVAVFGQKDAQQAIVIKRMTRDLNFDVNIEVAPIVRESDGLAMSSRNEYLTPEQRRDAPILKLALNMAEEQIVMGERKASVIKDAMGGMIEAVESSDIDYLAIVDPSTLEEVDEINSSVLIAVAVRFGKARLIDNVMVSI